MDLIPATSVAARTQWTTRERRAHRLRLQARAVDVVVAVLGVVVALFWLPLLSHEEEPSLLAVPVLIGVAASAVFWKRLVPQALARAAFWGSFLCASLIVFTGKSAAPPEQGAALCIALAAAPALVLLSRVSRRARGHHPGSFVVVVLALADIGIHGLVCCFIPEPEILRLFGGIAALNAAGLLVFAVTGRRVPHVVANVAVVGLVLGVVDDFPNWFSLVLIGCALAQIAAMATTLLPQPSATTQRRAGRALAGAVALTAFVEVLWLMSR